MEALRDATNKAPRVTTCGHHLCGDCAELWFATETKCPVCSAKCVGVPGGLEDIKAPVTKVVAPPEEPTRATTPAVREEAVYTPVEDDHVLNEEPVVDGPTYAATEPTFIHVNLSRPRYTLTMNVKTALDELNMEFAVTVVINKL